MSQPTIHPQLAADSHRLGDMPGGTLLLARNAELPWFIYVPATDALDVLDLPVAQSAAVVADCTAISAYIKEVLGWPKVNFAGLGNQVPQMHLHIVGRRPGDICWPQPIWGNLHVHSEYSPAELQMHCEALEKRVGLRASTL